MLDLRSKLLKTFPYLLKGISVMGGTASISAANLIIAILLTNSKGLAYYGEFAFFQAIFLTYSVLFRPVTWQAIIKYAPVCNPETLVSFSLKIEFLFAFLGSLLLNFSVYFFYEEYYSLEVFFISLVFIAINNGTLIGYTRAKNSYYYVSSLIALSSIGKVAIAFIFNHDAFQVFFYMTLVEASLWSVFIYFKLSKFSFKIPNVSDYLFDTKGFYNYSLWAMLHEILDLPVRHLDKVIVGGFLGNTAVGVLDLVKRISQIVAQFSVPLNALVFPKYSYWFHEKKYETIKKVNFMITGFLIICSVVVVFVFYFFFQQFDERFFSGQLSDHQSIAIGYLAVQLIAVVFVWIHPLSLITMKMSSIAKIILFANFFYLLALFVTIEIFGLYSALLAFSIQVIFVITLKSLNVYKVFKALP